ncbi:hypothetical protein [Micromonospora sp. WMMD1082]|nr:hypothetical protein [Micromonospora sp. WMMD1082]MDG4797972.1 hypothetical protein [Micromonospora sp. WMMD1082]
MSFVPGVPDLAEHLRLLAAAAQDLAPRLGWRPAHHSPAHLTASRGTP